MHKKIKIMATAAILTLSMSTTALAYESPVDDLKNVLIEIGIPSNYIGNIVEHLQKIKINKNQADKLMDIVKEAQGIIGNTTNLAELPSSLKAKLQTLAVQAGKIVRLNVKFGKDVNGVTTMVVTTYSGGTLLQLTTLEVIDLVTNFDVDIIAEAIEEAVEFSNDPNKNDLDGDGKPDKGKPGTGEDGFVPEGGGELNDTATPYANLMLAGTSMMGMAGGLHYIGRRKNK